MNRSQKEAVVAALHDKFRRSRGVVLTDYRGLNVAAITELRRRLEEAGVEYRVVKNTLAKLAIRDTEAAPLAEHLSGPCALALSYDDEVAPAKLLLEQVKKLDKLEIKAGVISGRLLGVEDLKQVINLPSRQQLHAQLLGLLAAVPGRFLGVLGGVPRNFLGVLSAPPRDFLGLLRAVEQKRAQ